VIREDISEESSRNEFSFYAVRFYFCVHVEVFRSIFNKLQFLYGCFFDSILCFLLFESKIKITNKFIVWLTDLSSVFPTRYGDRCGAQKFSKLGCLKSQIFAKESNFLSSQFRWLRGYSFCDLIMQLRNVWNFWKFFATFCANSNINSNQEYIIQATFNKVVWMFHRSSVPTNFLASAISHGLALFPVTIVNERGDKRKAKRISSSSPLRSCPVTPNS
jgi:hypothetical protein